MELYLVRHAHAGDPAKWQRDDAERPLSDKGRRQAERLGAVLAGAGVRVDVLASSPKVRALETARIVGVAVGVEPVVHARLGAGFGLGDLAGLIAACGNPTSLMIVGHDPDFSDLLGDLVGAPGLCMRKGALALVELDGPPTPDAGILRWLVPPDLLASGSD